MRHESHVLYVKRTYTIIAKFTYYRIRKLTMGSKDKRKIFMGIPSSTISGTEKLGRYSLKSLHSKRKARKKSIYYKAGSGCIRNIQKTQNIEYKKEKKIKKKQTQRGGSSHQLEG